MAIGSQPKGRPLSSRPGGKGDPRKVPAKPYDNTIEGNLRQLLDDQSLAETPQVSAEELDAADAADAPLVRLVNSLLLEAIRANASDIHIEPFENLLRVRLRIDGVLAEIQKIPHKLGPAITSRLKILAGLDICERRMPQDGVIHLKVDNVEADFRVSTLPSVYGEKTVLRVMGRANVKNDLSRLGIPDGQLTLLREAIQKPDGLVLVTGPTGSGKTTTLYAALNELNDISVSVFTAEDPVEGDLPGVTQVQVNTAVGFTFASVLRSLLRQDPDVVLVGEIRDQETAEISIKAALTGHLVLSTLHTNCAAATISRLINMGIAPYLITSSVNCIVAQRLVRKICENCKQAATLPPEALEKLGAAKHILSTGQVYAGKGCPECRSLGYKGRTPIYEILVLSDDLRRGVLSGASKDELKMIARRNGMITLRESALNLVRQGVTTLEEALSVTNEDSDKEAMGATPTTSSQAQPALAEPAKIQPSRAPTSTLAPSQPAPIKAETAPIVGARADQLLEQLGATSINVVESAAAAVADATRAVAKAPVVTKPSPPPQSTATTSSRWKSRSSN